MHCGIQQYTKKKNFEFIVKYACFKKRAIHVQITKNKRATTSYNLHGCLRSTRAHDQVYQVPIRNEITA